MVGAMKKIFFSLVLFVASLSVQETMAQNSGFYVYTGDAFVASGMAIDHKFEDNTSTYLTGTYTEKVKGDGYSLYSTNEKYISLGIGYRFQGGLGIEVGVMDDILYSAFKEYDGDKNEGKSYQEALVAGLYKSSAINDNLNLIVSMSYRHLILGGESYHDVLIEPINMEYMTGNGHWGFRLSLFSIEALTRTAKEEVTTQYPQDSFNNSLGTISVGLNLNSFPIRVCYYF